VVSITQPTAITLITSQTNVTSFGGSNGTATVTASGGTSPYTYSWNTIPVQTTTTATGLSASTYQVTVTDSKGCTKTASVTITQPVFTCNQFRTETQSGWDVTPNGSNAGTYLANNFAAVFPGANGLVIGGTGCGSPKSLKLTSVTAVRNFLPNTSGAPAALSANLVNPTNVTYLNPLAGELVALTLNVKFDLYDPNFAPTSSVALASMIYNQAPLAGYTVQQILNEGNKVLAGCGGPFSAGQLRTAIQNINQSWAGGVQGNSVLNCPAPPRPAGSPDQAQEESGSMMNAKVYPNPNNGYFTLRFENTSLENYTMEMTDLTGRVVYRSEGVGEIGINQTDYNFSNLPKGVYMIHLREADTTRVLKVVLQ
jgi:hypothetical protein